MQSFDKAQKAHPFSICLVKFFYPHRTSTHLSAQKAGPNFVKQRRPTAPLMESDRNHRGVNCNHPIVYRQLTINNNSNLINPH